MYSRTKDGRGECDRNLEEEERSEGGGQGCRQIGSNRRIIETFQVSAAWTVSMTTEATTAASVRDANDPSSA